MTYATVAQVKEYLDIESTQDDSLLADLAARTDRMMEVYTGRCFSVAEDATRKFDAIGDVDGRTLWLGDDLCQISAITNGDGEEVIAGEYVTKPHNVSPYFAIRLLASSRKYWTWEDDPEGAISITGRWGYSLTPPADIVHCAVRLVAFLYRQKDGATEGNQPRMSPDGVLLMPSDFPKDVLRILERYRKVI